MERIVPRGRTAAMITALVAAVWTLFGVVWGAQNALQQSIRGDAPNLSGAVRGALIQTLPWIPVTLAVIYVTLRFPLRRGVLGRHLALHAVAAVAGAFVSNVLVVLGYWVTSGKMDTLAVLMQQGALWTTLRIHIALLVYAAIAGLTQGIEYYRAARQREVHLARIEAQLNLARLHALNAQIRPHFLFNTLHTIGQLWRSGRSDDADAMLDHLGALFNKVQATTARAEVSLADELELIEDYLAVERARFPDRLRAVVNASPEAEHCLVPPLLLQPLVENAVRHGISQVPDGGTVEVRAVVEREQLLITISDDGAGMRAQSRARGAGVGLSNTRERLAQLYGAAAGLEIDSAGRGTRVLVRVPARAVSQAALELA